MRKLTMVMYMDLAVIIINFKLYYSIFVQIFLTKIIKMKYLTFGFAVLLFIGCSSIKVTSDFDTTVDFTQFKTFEYYGWAEESNKILNQLEQERIEDAFGKELKKRGLTGVEKGEGGDLIITLYIVTEQKTSTTANTTTTGMGGYGGYGYGYGGYRGYGPAYGWGGMSHSTTTYSENDYTVGTLIIDVYDAKEKKLVWESVGKGTIKESKTTAEREKNTNIAVAKIMAAYPIAAIKE